MNCKKIRELLITDYIDKEASQKVQKEVAAHLTACADCSNFYRLLQEKVSLPLKKIKTVNPPEEIWLRVEESIEKDQAVSSPVLVERLFEFLRGNLLFRRPVFTFSTVITVILITVFFMQLTLRKQQLVKDYLREQSKYMLSLSGPVNGDLEKDLSFGTAIETYLF